jgi:predicted alpha/beta-fold hydrolase
MRLLPLGLGLFILGSLPALADDYGFPDLDGFAATVIATPKELQPDLSIKGRPFRLKGLTVFPDRPISRYVWYHDKLRYLVFPQRGPAPLIFLIAGTGSSYHGPHMTTLYTAFYLAGFHVVGLPSPTSFQFMVTASSTGVPGILDDDTRDLYRVMQMAWEQQLSKDLEVTDFYVTGYSLGGAQTAFVMKLDEQEKVFNFKKGLMINPPVSLYNSALLLDGYLRDNITTGAEAMLFWDNLTAAMAEEYANTQGAVNLGPDFLYEVYRRRRPDDKNLATLIGLAFAITAQNMVTVADVRTESGYIVPVGTTARLTADVTEYFLVSARTPFRLYFRDLLVPYYRRSDPGITEDALINRASLHSIEEFLRTSDKLGLSHNVDDIIMAEGEIDWLVDVFGDRARIWPRGGHCGNMAYRENVEHMLAFFGASLPEGR